MIKLVTGQEMRDIERAVEDAGVTIPQLIERAGEAVVTTAELMCPAGHITILAGPGNNGSDGITAARLLATCGRDVSLYTFKRAGSDSEVNAEVFRAEDDEQLPELDNLLARSALIVDSLLGTGQNRRPEGTLASILARVDKTRRRSRQSLAVDVPTGVNADTGAVAGPAFGADRTLCMGFAKRGVALYPGASYAGQVEVAQLEMPRRLADQIRVGVPEATDIAARLPPRDPAANKGSSGRVMVIGGSRDFVGAPALVALAAYRSGAGLVEVALPDSVRNAVASHATEAIYRILPEDGGQIRQDAAPTVRDGLDRARVAVLGPGMGLTDATVQLVQALIPILTQKRRPTLIDADGLNALARIAEWWAEIPDLVITPHPGEMARLTGLSVDEIQSDRISVALRFAAKWGVIVVLKGAGTVVARPDGEALVNPTGGPNLAAAGTGDVLSGVIGGLMAQGCSPWDAAVAGVYLHGRAGDILRAEHGDVGTIASDLLAVLPSARLSILDESEGDE